MIRKPISELYDPLITTHIKPISDYLDATNKLVKELADRTKKTIKHPHIEQVDILHFQKAIEKYANDVKEFDNKVKEKIENQTREILKLEGNDTVLDSFNKYFTVGQDYSFEQIIEITKEGKHRYEFKIPPGYEDLKEKEGTQIFGDLIAWKQLLDFAFAKKSNIVFICNDFKKDWCILDDRNSEKRIKSPREELIAEFADKTGKFFWMYSQDQFIYTSNKILKSNITSDQIEQILQIIATKITSVPELEILESKYYTGQASCDPTAKLKSLINNNVLNTIASNDLCGDPQYGVVKKLKIKYSFGAEIYEKEYTENDPVHLP